ncbi:hypothetical protein [Aeoliella mucimassa]|uniref:Uncharacterized protein n=1 Tax=Aeoliella mucimassa TaxID=2527972 RepID=A0A518AHI2_9BACT|nr:hypothetical protein [Aeoliella mucimassa]QDU54180.1 hypothetical protein Pan181_03600 [Aeoliella mucimassa]
MKVAKFGLLLPALLPLLAGVQSCTLGVPGGTYQVDTFAFVPTKPAKPATEPQPSVWIDTNLKLSSLSGGTLTSSLPCSVKVDYTDNSETIEAAVFTSVKVTYDDAVVEPAVKTLKLPLRIKAREYEAVNSVSGGKIVHGTVWHISGEIPKLITRDQPLRIEIKGYFAKKDGEQIPIAIDQHFDIRREKGEKPAVEVLQD